ncbi:MAG: hypothetical protein EA396_04525 [Anaerolineaceae bacterium]|nr:MAG: hypothetical protein EA396_04525 [Anaerolineaceae bacterium]
MADLAHDTLFDDPRQAIIERVTKRMGEIKSQLAELKNQISQTQQVVEREQDRYSDIAFEIQTIEATLESRPRDEIRDKYKEALDVRFRLATMRGQYEKFEAQYEQLQAEQALLSDIMSKVQGVHSFEIEEDDEPERGTINIVRIVQAQEEERQRLARQMHDGPAQSLTNFILQAEICQRLFDRNPERAGEELGNLKEAASVTFQKVRDFIFDLRPMMLDDLGVVPTIKRWVDSVREKNAINIDLTILGEERRLKEQHKEVMIFRAVQDLVGYARDYANSQQIKVRIDFQDNPVLIQVSDNGRAIDVEDLMSRDDHQDARAQGFLTLKEKFELVKGNFSISSDEGEGTKVRLELPVS